MLVGVLHPAKIYTVRAAVGGTGRAADVHAVHLHGALQRHGGAFGGNGLAQLCDKTQVVLC